MEQTLKEVTEEATECAACGKKIPFDRGAPYVSQPDDVPDHKMSIAAASVVMSSEVEGVVCDAACLDAWEEYADE